VTGKRPLLVLGVLVLSLPLGSRSLTAQLVPAGPEVRADTLANYFPDCPHLAVADDRSFEIVWDYDGIGDYFIHGRHFDPAGEPTDPAQLQLGPSGSFDNYNKVDFVTALPNGFQVFITNFDAIFEHPPVDFRQRLDLAGSPAGPPEMLKLGTLPAVGPTGTLYVPSYQARPENLAIQQVAADGTAQGRRIVLNSRPIVQPSFLQIAPQHGGNFVAAWSGLSVEKRPRQVLRARIVRQGVPFGQDFDINSLTGGHAGVPPFLGGPLVASSPSTGSFAVVWTVADAAGNTSIHLRFFDATGKPLTPETVAVPSAKPVFLVSAALDDAGHLLLLWQPPLAGVLRARIFTAAGGAPLGAAFQLEDVSDYYCGNVAWAGDSWLITWLALDDGGKHAVVWRRFTEN
jgi:hypothetical protein